MKQILNWSARHTVFANLLMAIMVIIGVIAVFQIRSELLPQFALDRVSVNVAWEGASPAEVEEGICIKIEEALTGVEGVKKITSIAYEGRCEVAVELHAWIQNSRDLMEDIQQRNRPYYDTAREHRKAHRFGGEADKSSSSSILVRQCGRRSPETKSHGD